MPISHVYKSRQSTMNTHHTIHANLTAIMNRCEAHCRALARPLPILVVVSKTQPPEAIEAVLALGFRHFGENRVQEALRKWPALRQRYPDIVLHLIGNLQTNKAKEALELFDVIHTVDRPSLLEKIVRLRATCPTRTKEFFVEVNLGDEAQKAGVSLEQADIFIAAATHALPINGLMAIPPKDKPPVPAFQTLAALAQHHNLHGLSMGMSNDWEDALVCGATHLRLGTAIFGNSDKRHEERKI